MPPEGQPSGEHFGLVDSAPEAGTQNDPLEDAPTEAPATEQATPPPAQGDQQGQAETTPEGDQAQPEGEQTPQQLYAGRYQKVEDLESGYKNIQRLHSRTAEQLRAQELRNQQMEAALQRVMPYLQQLQQNGQQPPEFDPSDPQQIQRVIDQRVAQATQNLTAQQQAQQAASVIDSFRAEHPDVAPGTELDVRMAQVITEFQRDPDGNRRPDLFPLQPENLNVAYELARDENLLNMTMELDLQPSAENIQIAKEALAHPAFAEVLLAQPHLLDTDHGLNYARKQANLPTMVANAQATAQAAQPNAAQMRQRAFVETGGAATPVGGSTKTGDEFDEAVKEYNGSKQNSVFGL